MEIPVKPNTALIIALMCVLLAENVLADYYGTIDEINQVPFRMRGKTFFLRPDKFIPECNKYECLSWLQRNIKFNCSDTLNSTTQDSILAPSGMSIRPSCTERQVIRRVSPPADDIGDILSTALITIDSGHMPCSIVAVTGNDTGLAKFDLDNSECTSHFPKDTPLYLSAAVVIMLQASSELHNISIHDLQSVNSQLSFFLYAGAISLFPGKLKNLSLTSLHGHHVMLDNVYGDIRIDESVRAMSFCINCSNIPNSEKIDILMGPHVFIKLLSAVDHAAVNHVKYKLGFIIGMITTFGFVVYNCTRLMHHNKVE